MSMQLQRLLLVHFIAACTLAPAFGAQLKPQTEEGCATPLHARITSLGSVHLSVPTEAPTLDVPLTVRPVHAPAANAAPRHACVERPDARAPPIVLQVPTTAFPAPTLL